jgi:alpha-beta hydrolase superfamily lysophospholipase
MEDDFTLSGNELFLPILVLLAGHDEIVDNIKVKKWFETLPTEDKTIKAFANFYHVMPFEEEISPLLEAISGWIKEREPSLASQGSKN